MRRDGIQRMCHRVRRLDDAHGDLLRLLERLLCQQFHIRWEGGGEHHRLPFIRHSFDDAAHVGQEAHIEHAIGFVEHEHFDVRHLCMSLCDEVQQTTRAGDQDLRAVAQGLDLRRGSDSAVNGGALQLGAHRQHFDHVVDLLRQFARRGDDERARRVALTFEQFVQNRQHERGGLAGSGLGCTDNVPSAYGGGDGGLLNGGGCIVTRLLDSLHEAGVEIELREVHKVLIRSTYFREYPRRGK